MIPRFFGLDTHKQFVMVAAVDQQQTLLQSPYRINMPQLERWAANTLTADDTVVIEVTTNTWQLHKLLSQYAGQVVVANPYKTKLIAEARIKSDKVDAIALAQLLASRFIAEVWVPDQETQQHRNLAAHRATLVRQRTQIKNRLQSLLTRHNLQCPHKSLFTQEGRQWLAQQTFDPVAQLECQHWLRQLAVLNQDVHETEQLVARLAVADNRVPRLMQLTGIGVFTAFAILAQIGDIHRFPSPKKLASFAGLVPSLHQSGNRSYNGRITKAGSPMLRWLLVEAARIAVRFDPHWQAIYDRLKAQRGANIAAVAVARKLLVVIWHLLHNQSTYRFLCPQTYVTKLQQWARLIGRKQLAGVSSRQFVEQQLQRVQLEHLSQSLISTQKGNLKVQFRNSHQT